MNTLFSPYPSFAHMKRVYLIVSPLPLHPVTKELIMTHKTFWSITAVFIVSLSFSASADCFISEPCYSIGGTVQQADDRGLVVNVRSDCQFNPPPLTVPFADTVFESEYLSRLMTLYENCDVAVIASATKVKAFIPALTEINKNVFLSESVMVSIETVLKGQVQPLWTFIHQRSTPSYQLWRDSVTGKIDTIVITMSHSSPGYTEIKDDRFLLFLKNIQISSGQKFNLPLPADCAVQSFAYKVDSTDNIFFDGYSFDGDNKKVALIPELRLPLTTFSTAIKTSTRQQPPRVSPVASVPVEGTLYNLLGKKLLPVHNRSYQQPSGCVIYKPAGKSDSRIRIRINNW